MTVDKTQELELVLAKHIRDEVEHSTQRLASMVLIACGISSLVVLVLFIGVLPIAISKFVQYPWPQEKPGILQKIQGNTDAINGIRDEFQQLKEGQKKILESVSDPLAKSVLRDRRLSHENTKTTREGVAKVASRDSTSKGTVHGSVRRGSGQAAGTASESLSP